MAKVTTTLFGSLALLPMPAQAPMVESLAWLTDVINSYNGTEERHQLRGSPRTQIQYNIPQQAWTRQRAYNTERGGLRQKWAVPVWSQVQLIGAVANAATSINCDTVNYDLRANSLALLYESEDAWQVVEISAKTDASITVTATQAFTRAVLVPLRIGYVSGTVRRNSNGHNAVSIVTFDLEDNVALTSDAPTQFLSYDLDTDEVLFEDRYEAELDAEENKADYELGLVARIAPWTYTRHSMSYMKVLTTPAEVLAFRKWLHRRAGKYRAFWQPTYEHDLRVASTGTINTTIRFKKDSYQDWAADRTHIAIQDDAGTWYPRTLSNVTSVDSTTLQCTLNAALGLAASRIRRVSYLGLKRLSSDRVELAWVGNGVCKVSIGVTELSP